MTHEQAFASLSRELWLRCTRSGRLTWLDPRAQSYFQVEAGVPLQSLAAPGTEDKVSRFLASLIDPPSVDLDLEAGDRPSPTEGLLTPPPLLSGPDAQDGSDQAWEVVLCVHGQPTVLALHAKPSGDDIAIIASCVPADYAAVLEQLNDNLSDLAKLQRETERQQRELLRRHEELIRLYRETDEGNKAVVALHAEIGEKDDSLRRAAEVKARLVANVSHEFRTPLNSILGLTNLLLTRSDGDINEEQERQLNFIRQSSEALYALVNDMLDLSKAEAGKVGLHAEVFDVSRLFASMRGIMRPLVNNPDVELIFRDPTTRIELETDEAKIAQILRNLVSNALKFTERGRVEVECESDAGWVTFRVRDTGIGIPPELVDRVFEEFFQVEGAFQQRAKGTGLGLSLSRHLAERLGGSLTAESEVGVGSVFTLHVPARHPEVAEMSALTQRSARVPPNQHPILVVEDDRQTLFLYEKYLRGSGYHVIPARSIEDARAVMKTIRPSAVVLDVMLDGETSWRFLHDLKSNAETRDIPALVVTVTNREERARALGADEFCVKPIDRDWLLAKLRHMARHQQLDTILVIDDDQVSRYLLRKILTGTPYTLLEAESGDEGVRLARSHHPQVIFLDFVMPEMSAFDVLDELKRDPATRAIPVIVHTSKDLAEEERRRLELEASAILSKQSLSRELAIGRIREALEKAGLRGQRNAASAEGAPHA